jgi:hypothetical protein
MMISSEGAPEAPAADAPAPDGAPEAPAPAPAAGAAALFGEPDAAAPDGGTPWWQNDSLKVSAEKVKGAELSDAEWIENKKFGSFADMVKSARALESKMGAADKVVVPKGADDKDALAAMAKAMGVPEAPAGYDIKLSEGYDEGFVDSFKTIAHETALAPWQVQKVVDWFEGATAAAAEVNAGAARAALEAEWGQEYKKNIAVSQRGMAALGLTPDDLNGLSVGYGLDKTMKLMAKIGGGISEDNGLFGEGGGGRTVEQLVARKNEIIRTPELAEKLRKGDPALKAEWDAAIAAEARMMEQKYK